MPKNTKKGKNAKNKGVIKKRHLRLKEPEQAYARATKMLGNCNIECVDVNNDTKWLGIIRRCLRRGAKNRIVEGSLLLVSLRDFQDDKVDVIHVYNKDEARQLEKLNHIPTEKHDTNDLFEFDDEDEEGVEEEKELFEFNKI